MARASARWRGVCAEIDARAAARLRPPSVQIDRKAIVLGRNEHAVPILLGERARLEHSHFIGTTGGGKSKSLEHCIRQDIAAGRGVFVADPHGEHPDGLYRSLLGWLDRRGYTRTRTIHLIDPNAPSATVGFNPLQRPDEATDLSVVAGLCLEAFERAWGNEDTHDKPTIRRVLKATFTALAELGLTLAEAKLLYDPDDPHRVRAWAAENVRDRYAREELQRLHQLSLDPRRRHDFDIEVLGPINRLAEFVSASAIRTIVGQTERVLDMRAALDEGHIILANLSGGSQVYQTEADLLGRLLVRLLFFHAKRRRNPHIPFFAYLDECHRYLSGDLENILAEIRKYGVGAVLSHQWLAQLGVESDNLLAAVRNATNFKAVFRLRDPVEAQELAEMVVPLDLEMPVTKLVKPTVVGHRRVSMTSESVGDQHATSDMRSISEGRSLTETDSYAQSYAETVAAGESSSRAGALGSSQGLSQISMTGTGNALNSTQMMTPETGWLDPQAVLGVSEGSSTAMQSSQGIGSSTASSRSSGWSFGKSSMRATARGEAWGQAMSRGVSEARSAGSAETRGTTTTRGRQESFEAVYENLPSSVHSKEAMLYFAASTLRGLKTGTAFINFVDTGGMRAALLRVPNVEDCAPPPDVFEVLRAEVLAASPSATPIDLARKQIEDRERDLVARSRRIRPSEPETAAGYRTKRKRPETTSP
jgi:hypothetical protein